MKIFDMEQGTKEWENARRCKITGTKLAKVMGTPYSQLELIAELIAEEGTEQTKNFRKTEEMERGTAEELFAIKLFEKETGKKTKEVGICVSDEFDWLTLSPDRLIFDETGRCAEAIEAKSPNSTTIIKYRIMNMVAPEETNLTPAKKPFLGVPAEYKWQVVQYFLVNPDLRKLYFVVYDERFIDPKAKLYIVEVDWENELLQEAILEAREELKTFREKWLAWKEIVLPDNF